MRADRLISILMYLQSEGRLTARELAGRLEVSERTIYRDVDALSAAGVPIYTDPGNGGGISLPPEYRIKADGLTTPEVQALFLQAGQQADHLGIGPALRSGLLKLLNALPSRHRTEVEWIRERVYLDTDSWTPQQMSPDILGLAQQAVWETRAVTLIYTDRNGRSLDDRVEPYGLVAKAGIWFLVGSWQGRIRAFRVARIASLRLLEERFERPPGFQLAEYWRAWMRKYRNE